MAAKHHLIARCLVGALVCVAPALLGAGAPEAPTIKTRPEGRSEAARGWDGKVQGRQLVTPVELRFEDPRDLEAFAAGRLPIGLTLRSAASGQTVRLAPALVREGFRPGRAAGPLALYVLIDNLLAPVWDEAGCTQTAARAGNGADGTGVELDFSYGPCGAARAAGNPVTGVIVKGGSNGATMRTAGAPIGGIVVKGGKNPGGNLHVAVAPTEIVEDAHARVRTLGGGQNLVIAVAGKGAGSPKANGF